MLFRVFILLDKWLQWLFRLFASIQRSFKCEKNCCENIDGDEGEPCLINSSPLARKVFKRNSVQENAGNNCPKYACWTGDAKAAYHASSGIKCGSRGCTYLHTISVLQLLHCGTPCSILTPQRGHFGRCVSRSYIAVPATAIATTVKNIPMPSRIPKLSSSLLAIAFEDNTRLRRRKGASNQPSR